MRFLNLKTDIGDIDLCLFPPESILLKGSGNAEEI